MDFEAIIQKIEKVLHDTQFCALATANSNGVVSIAQMTLVSDGLKVYFQTDKNFEKVKNILQNENVAINCGAFSFKGRAKIVGSPLSNERYIEEIKRKHMQTYLSYTNLPTEVLIEVELTQCKIWSLSSEYVHNADIITEVDLENKTVKVINCDKMQY